MSCVQNRDWLWYLNWHPMFAQYRAFYILLAYQDRSSEVDTALSLLFITGLLCFTCVLLLEMELTMDLLAREIQTKAKTAWQRLKFWCCKSDSLNQDLVVKTHHLDTMVRV